MCVSFFLMLAVTLQMMTLNEEEALKRILGTPVNETPISARLRAEETAAESKGNSAPIEESKLSLDSEEIKSIPVSDINIIIEC